jgi:hypothetical protein
MISLISKYVSKEFVIIGIIAYVAGYFQHKIKGKALKGYDRFGEVVTVVQPWRSTYFCPDYCTSDHEHYAHNIEYLCDNDTICNHYIYRNFKKDK